MIFVLKALPVIVLYALCFIALTELMNTLPAIITATGILIGAHYLHRVLRRKLGV